MLEHSAKINAVTFEPETKNIIACTSNKLLCVIDVQTSTQTYFTTLKDEPISLAWLDSYLLIGNYEGNLQIWNPQTAAFISEFHCHEGFLITPLFNIISTAERNKMLSRLRLTEDAISVEANRKCYLDQDSQNVLSRPRLTEDAISAEDQRTCYLGRVT